MDAALARKESAERSPGVGAPDPRKSRSPYPARDARAALSGFCEFRFDQIEAWPGGMAWA